MKFNPNEEPKPKAELLEGVAIFEVVRAEEKISKTTGNDMIKLIFKIWDCKGNEGILSDYFPSTVPWKLKQFLAAANRLDLYKKGEVSPDTFQGMGGKCELKYELSTQYGKQVKVKSYLGQSEKEETQPLSEEDKDMPF